MFFNERGGDPKNENISFRYFNPKIKGLEKGKDHREKTQKLDPGDFPGGLYRYKTKVRMLKLCVGKLWDLLSSLGDGVCKFSMFGQRFHGVRDDVLTGLEGIDAIAYDKTVEVLIYSADGFARADGLGWDLWFMLRITHIPRSSEKYFIKNVY